LIHVTINEILVIAVVWLAITGGPVVAGFLLGLARRRRQQRERGRQKTR
jgi:hypothetical protein